MGTRADFYIKRNEVLEWQGSVEGYSKVKDIPYEILQSTNEHDFKERLTSFLNKSSTAKKVEDGWPWFLNSSRTSDFAYVLWEEKAAVFISTFGSPAYSYWQHQEYQTRFQKAKKYNTPIEDFKTYSERISSFTPSFPAMKPRLS